MKKIDILIPNFEDFGAQRVAINVANGLAADYEVSFVTFADNGPFKGYLDSKITTIKLDYGRSNIPKFRIFPRFVRYWKYAKNNSTDIAIAFSPVANLVILFAKLFKKDLKTIIQEHGFPSLAIKDRQNMGPLLELVFRFVIFKLYNISDIFLCITEAIKEDFINNFNTKKEIIRVVRNPVDIIKLRQLAKEDTNDVYLDPKKKYLVSIGRLVDQKNYFRLLRIFAIVKKRVTELELIIFGEGQDRNGLINFAAELGLASAFHLPGFHINPYASLAKADCFCLASNWEGLPQVIAEAMLLGTAVVANDCPSGPSEMIEDGKTGRLIKLGDEQAFAEAIIDLLANPQNKARIESEAIKFAEAEYSIEKCVAMYKKIIEEDLKL